MRGAFAWIAGLAILAVAAIILLLHLTGTSASCLLLREGAETNVATRLNVAIAVVICLICLHTIPLVLISTFPVSPSKHDGTFRSTYSRLLALTISS